MCRVCAVTYYLVGEWRRVIGGDTRRVGYDDKMLQFIEWVVVVVVLDRNLVRSRSTTRRSRTFRNKEETEI